jgi:excisionase family DNA binding protein
MSNSIDVTRRRPLAVPLTETHDDDPEVVRDDGHDGGCVGREPEMLTYGQAAQYLNVPVGTLYDWVHRKVVPHVRLGPRLVRFPRSALVQWLDERSVDGRAVAT